MKQFEFIETDIPGVIEIQPTVHYDSRGYFIETYQKDLFVEAGINKEFVQDNESMSSKGVLRGLHFQKRHTQAKLIRVTKGIIFDVAVDCRPNSPTFGKWTSVVLDENKKNLFYVPEGFAHGFLVLSDYAEFAYKCTDFYDPESEGGILWDDPTIGIKWPELDIPFITSDRDKKQLLFKDQDFDYFRKY